jgi:hypothetical protein
MFINGPYNAVRLEGSINNINKIIYLFLDIHLSPSVQTDCASYESVNIDKYLYDIFKKTSNPLDFFFEIKESFASKNLIPIFKPRYIESVQKLYKKVQLDEDTKKNIKKYVRLHYMDIRDHLEKNIYYYNDVLQQNISTILSNRNITSNNFVNILESCTGLIYELEIYQTFFDKENKLSRTNKNLKNSKSSNKDIVKYFLNKITKKYKNKDIINKLKKNYFNDILEKINKCIEKLKELKKLILTKESYVYRSYETKNPFKNNPDDILGEYYLPTDLNELIYELNRMAEFINSYILFIFAKITDLFFLRRFLDKDYVTKAIVYTGGAHSINYINVLTTYFDFKITHVSYSDVNIEKLNNIAKEDIQKLDYSLSPPKLIQCVDLSTFPDDFN